jgi:hypothetical protein
MLLQGGAQILKKGPGNGQRYPEFNHFHPLKNHAGENVTVPRVTAFRDWLLEQAQYSPARGQKQALENNTWLKRLYHSRQS